jgi:peptide-methionine (S)-S-oxide reductase
MVRFIIGGAVAAAVAFPIAASVSRRVEATVVPIPDPVVALPNAKPAATQTIVLAGGCFWGVEAVYEHMKGVIEVVSGYAGGTPETAEYEVVSSGRTAHAEVVKVTFDPSKVSYAQILKVFFSVVHDPTQLNRQGPDIGPQYRSAIFFSDDEQAAAARAYIEQLDKSKVFPRPIVTQVVPLKAFYLAEKYHQDFAANNPEHPYIVYHDLPKIANFKKQFPEMYR